MAAPAANFDALLPRLDLGSADDLLISLVRELVALRDDPDRLAAQAAAMPDGGAGDLPASALVDSAMIDAAYALRTEQGFHGLEYDGSGAPYRWTGPNRAFHFELTVNRTRPLELRLRYSRMYENPKNEFVKCYVDGVEIEAQTVAVGNEFEVLATLPAREGAGVTNLTWMCPRVRSPADLGESTDVRKLGLTFRWLKIGTPADTRAERGAPKKSVAEKILRRALKLTQSKAGS
jgi:hypothetical protein